MEINIGDNNKINKSTIGNNNDMISKNNKLVKEIIIGVVIAIISAIILWILGIPNP